MSRRFLTVVILTTILSGSSIGQELPENANSVVSSNNNAKSDLERILTFPTERLNEFGIQQIRLGETEFAFGAATARSKVRSTFLDRQRLKLGNELTMLKAQQNELKKHVDSEIEEIRRQFPNSSERNEALNLLLIENKGEAYLLSSKLQRLTQELADVQRQLKTTRTAQKSIRKSRVRFETKQKTASNSRASRFEITEDELQAIGLTNDSFSALLSNGRIQMPNKMEPPTIEQPAVDPLAELEALFATGLQEGRSDDG